MTRIFTSSAASGPRGIRTLVKIRTETAATLVVEGVRFVIRSVPELATMGLQPAGTKSSGLCQASGFPRGSTLWPDLDNVDAKGMPTD
jgi:hypothetical protein